MVWPVIVLMTIAGWTLLIRLAFPPHYLVPLKGNLTGKNLVAGYIFFYSVVFLITAVSTIGLVRALYHRFGNPSSGT